MGELMWRKRRIFINTYFPNFCLIPARARHIHAKTQVKFVKFKLNFWLLHMFKFNLLSMGGYSFEVEMIHGNHSQITIGGCFVDLLTWNSLDKNNAGLGYSSHMDAPRALCVRRSSCEIQYVSIRS